ncbi:MAG TPA: lysylphosphatidylglycerol synthase transmembrane domain-containing protein [Chloroflexota bacterium]|nr:lysylphosphatidylglycerol synthase transmembrane domain-containing protein [Chloroflexota bacterium]
MLKLLWRKLRPWLPWAGVLVLLLLLIQAVHPAALWAALLKAQLWLLLPILACGLLGLLLRGIRWHLLLQAIGAPNTMLDSIILFTAAQSAVLLPGGQFLLPVLQRSEHGTAIRRSAPTILVQELIFGLLMLPAALPGVPPYHPAGWMLLAALVFNAGTGIFLLQSRVLNWALGLVSRVPFIRDHVHNLSELQQHFVLVARSPAVIWGTVFDMGTIALSGLGFYLSLLAVHATHITWIDATAIYALGSSVGTLSALPGGLGANEDVSTLVLGHMGVTVGQAAAGTLLFRVVNLIMNTAVGWAVLLLARRRLNVHPSPAGLANAVRGAEQKTLQGPASGAAPERALQ